MNPMSNQCHVNIMLNLPEDQKYTDYTRHYLYTNNYVTVETFQFLKGYNKAVIVKTVLNITQSQHTLVRIKGVWGFLL